jgi:hypothetical protein
MTVVSIQASLLQVLIVIDSAEIIEPTLQYRRNRAIAGYATDSVHSPQNQ